MSRVITSINFNLQMVVSAAFPPPCTVTFTDIAPDGHESPGRVTLVDADAASVWGATDLLQAVNTVLDAKAAALPDLPTIAAKMTEVDELDRKLRAKRAQVDDLDSQLASKAAELDAEPTLLGVKS